jgi:acetylglutamate kinase
MHMPYNFARTSVVKFGGAAMGLEAEGAFALEIRAAVSAGSPVVVVHGGGPEIDSALAEAGVGSERIDGLRVTDAATLAITERVLCGTLNKRLVRSLLAVGVPAVGLSGIDGGLLRARRLLHHAGDLGYVGEIVTVDVGPLRALLEGGFVPVVAPLALATGGEHALNVNADTAAGAIASAMGAATLLLVTNVSRVRANPENPASGMEMLSLDCARHFVRSSACAGSMKPKIQAAIAAVNAGVPRALIGNASISRMLGGDATTICA